MNEKTLKKIDLLSNILFIEYKGNLKEYNDTELYHDIHRAMIEEDYSKELLQRANKYWDNFKDIDYDTYCQMSVQVENESDGVSWYDSLYKLLTNEYESKDVDLFSKMKILYLLKNKDLANTP